MSHTRDTSDPIKLRAHQVLDEVRVGIHHDDDEIAWALIQLGEPVETKA